MIYIRWHYIRNRVGIGPGVPMDWPSLMSEPRAALNKFIQSNGSILRDVEILSIYRIETKQVEVTIL